MARYGSLDYPRLTKRRFLLGFTLFLIGPSVNLSATLFSGGLLGWEQALLSDLAVLGVLSVLVAPLVFSIVMPLTE